MANKNFLGGRGSRKPITHIEKLIRQAYDDVKAKEKALAEAKAALDQLTVPKTLCEVFSQEPRAATPKVTNQPIY